MAQALADLEEILLGRTQNHVVAWGDSGRHVHRAMVSDLSALIAAAREVGIDLRVASGFRSFEAQLSIWNAKASGTRPVLDALGHPVDVSRLSPERVIPAILRWSALPGLSRHHWGTDLDVYDAAVLPSGYQLQLTTQESATFFSALHQWLDERMKEFGFFRPYAEDLGGVSPEPWHLSYAPVSTGYQESHSLESVERAIAASEMRWKDLVLGMLPEIYDQYFLNVSSPAGPS